MKLKLALCIAALGLVGIASTASATMLPDTYNGSNGHNYGDVISNPGVTTFDVQGMDASLSGDQLTVIIYTNFAGHAGIDAQQTKGHTGIGYGDLFLSTGWTPNGSAPYNNDNAANGNHWEYAFSLDNPLNNSGGTGTVYALGDGHHNNHNPDVLLSDNFMNCSGSCEYRNGQAVAVNKKLADPMKQNTGTWTVGTGFLSFNIDIAGLDLDPGKLGFHWTMYCGNDVIEGLDNVPMTPVPEPAPLGMFLFGIGLIGLLGFMRQRNKARN